MTEGKYSESLASVDRYLAGHLDQSEREMVETRIVRDAKFRGDVELTAALRDGLRQLQAQGQVEPLLKARTWMWGRSPWAIAAALLACAIGVATLLVQRPQDESRPVLATQTLHFVTTRSGDARSDATWQKTSQPTRLQMRFDVGLEPAPEYRVTIVRVARGSTAPVFEVLAGRTGEGDVAIAVDSALLEPGDYGISLVPQPPDRLQEATHYTLRIAD